MQVWCGMSNPSVLIVHSAGSRQGNHWVQERRSALPSVALLHPCLICLLHQYNTSALSHAGNGAPGERLRLLLFTTRALGPCCPNLQARWPASSWVQNKEDLQKIIHRTARKQEEAEETANCGKDWCPMCLCTIRQVSSPDQVMVWLGDHREHMEQSRTAIENSRVGA